MKHIFCIRREERGVALAVVLVLVVLNAMLFYKYGSIITKAHHVSFWYLFGRTFHVSGFDDWSYLFMSNGKIYFEASRHPLFATILYPFYGLNKWLMHQGEVNYAYFLMALTLVFSALYAYIFLLRICREVIGLGKWDGVLLTTLFFSFAMIMTSVVVPDHFAWSLFLLLLTLYVSGLKLKDNRRLKLWQASVLAFLTAGVTLSNVAKTYLAVWFVNGWKAFWSWKNLALTVVLPLAVLGGIYVYQKNEIIEPQQQTNKKIEQEVYAKNKELQKRNAAHHERVMAKTAKPVTDKPFLEWIDVTTPRVASVVENLFGESVQFHQDYLLHDMCDDRPMIVAYRHAYHYVVEAVVVLLFIVGVVAGLRHRFFQLLFTWFMVDMVLHLVLGFGLNEVYIMASHWIFIIPIAMAYLLLATKERYRRYLRGVYALLLTWLLVYNGGLFIEYMSQQVTTIYK
jgi:hypothetical protein